MVFFNMYTSSIAQFASFYAQRITGIVQHEVKNLQIIAEMNPQDAMQIEH